MKKARTRYLKLRRLLAGTVTVAATIAVLAPASASAATLFSNPTPIDIKDNTTASPFPATIDVSGLRGPISDISVTLKKFSHDYPTDVDILLISPEGTDSVVMSDACGITDVIQTDFVFSERALQEMPSGSACTGNVYKPTNIGFSGDPFGPGAHFTSFNQFKGENPNGRWRLKVFDDTPGQTGQIEAGWSISIDTDPVDSLVPATGTTGAASSYPSTATVSGKTGVVNDVDVRLDGVFHENPDDLDVLLVGPQGQKVVLFSDACGSLPINDADWIFTDDAPGKAPDAPPSASCWYNVKLQPSDYEPGDAWPAPAPPGLYATSLSAFDFIDPNGDWKLFVNDDAAGGSGFIAKHFTVDVKTRPKAAVAFTENAVQVAEGETRTLTLRRTAESAPGPATVTVTSQPGSAAPGADFTPVATTVRFAAGETEKTVAVSVLTDGEFEPDETFAVSLASPTGDTALGEPSSTAVTIPAQQQPLGREPEAETGKDVTKPAVAVVTGKRLGRDGRLKVRVRCSEACSGNVLLVTSKKAKLGKGAFRITRAGSTTLKIKLSAAGRKALRRAKRVKVLATAIAVDAAANRGVGTAKATVRR